MASLSIRRLDDEVLARLKARARRESVSLEEAVRRILHTATEDEEPVGVAIRRIVGNAGYDLRLPPREAGKLIDFASAEFG